MLMTVAYLRGARCDAPPRWPDHENFLQATLYQKVRFFAIFQQELQNSTMFDNLLLYRYNMPLKSPCEITSDMTRRRRRELLKTCCKPYRPVIFRGGRVSFHGWVTRHYIWNQQRGSRRLAGARRGRWLINILKCQIWVQPEMNPPRTSIGYSKWDINLSKWDMPIIACNATMTALLRCVPLPWDCDTPYSQITSCSGIAAIMDTLCATLSELISTRIPGTKLRMPVSWYHNVIKRRSALFHISLKRWTV